LSYRPYRGFLMPANAYFEAGRFIFGSGGAYAMLGHLTRADVPEKERQPVEDELVHKIIEGGEGALRVADVHAAVKYFAAGMR